MMMMTTTIMITRNSSGDEIANVNFLYDNIVHALQNTIDLCMNSTTDRRDYVLLHRFTKFSEITQCNGHYAVQGHSRSHILVPIIYDFLLVYSSLFNIMRYSTTTQANKNNKQNTTNEKERKIMTAPLCTYKLSNLQYQLQILNHLA